MITVITGPMFASKSKRLIQYLTGAMVRKIPVAALKPEQDDRAHPGHLYSYEGAAFPATEIPRGQEWGCVSTVLQEVTSKEKHILAVDEVQFLHRDTVDGLVDRYLRGPHWLILCGLTKDSESFEFGHLGGVIDRYPNQVHLEELTARCSFCNGVATMTHCKVEKEGQILTGRDCFEPRCYPCWRFGKA